MKIGYPCLNRTLACRTNSTFRLASFSEERFLNATASNIECLRSVLRFNAERSILFFRISSDIIPFASHPVCTVPWQERFRENFRQLGSFIKDAGIRISMHPDQFTVLNSPDPAIVERSIRELRYHAEVLDLLGLDTTAKIQIHAGGVYGDKPAAIERLSSACGKLDKAIAARLVIENDDRSYTAQDCMEIHERTGTPLLFDVFHHLLNPGTLDARTAFRLFHGTWKKSDGILMVDYSMQKAGSRTGSHAESIDTEHFKAFLREVVSEDCDIMLEIKDKEKSAQKAVAAARSDPRFVKV